MKSIRLVGDHLVEQARKIEKVLVQLPGIVFASVSVDPEEHFDVFVGHTDEITNTVVDLTVKAFCGSLVSNRATFSVLARRGLPCKKH